MKANKKNDMIDLDNNYDTWIKDQNWLRKHTIT